MIRAEYAVTHFDVRGPMVSCKAYGNGHIHDTYLVANALGERWILQRINRRVFPDVPTLMRNIAMVTDHLSRKPSICRSLQLVPQHCGLFWYQDPWGDYWRMYDFIGNSVCLEQPRCARDLRQAGLAFGAFQLALSDFPLETLTEILPDFHNTPDRYRRLHEAVQMDPVDRLAEVGPELEFALAHERRAGELIDLWEEGHLSSRVTHNDTKLNNVLLDAEHYRARCVIDLDTVMPGVMAFDFGDTIRTGAATAAEDEQNLDLMELNLEYFEACARGFLFSCGRDMNHIEVETLPLGAIIMTLECGVRFLTDYLLGDSYFRIHRPGQNLDRCRAQFKLVADMERKEAEMNRIIRSI